MTIELKTIEFNHDHISAANSAMNIRRNYDFEIPIPEYDRDIPRLLNESCAAYGIIPTIGQDVCIRATFLLSDPLPGEIVYEVQASGGSIMGELFPIQVVFPAGSTSQAIDITLSNRKFTKIGRYDITWNWSFRSLGDSSWQQLVSTSHRIYLILNIPPSPWTQEYAHNLNPWSNILEKCCNIASGCKDAAAATRKLTKSIYGNFELRYDIRSGAPRYYSWETFRLTNWNDYVLDRNYPANVLFCEGNSEEYPDYLIVNCYDCAASLSIMAKILGAPVNYYFHQPFGCLNYVLPIGRGKCNNPFPGCSGTPTIVDQNEYRSGFGNHAYTKLTLNLFRLRRVHLRFLERYYRFRTFTTLPALLLTKKRIYDACMRQWVSENHKVILRLLWFLIFISSLGQINRIDLLDRADGYLIDLDQQPYNQYVIDTSEEWEDDMAGGSPTLVDLSIN